MSKLETLEQEWREGFGKLGEPSVRKELSRGLFQHSRDQENAARRWLVLVWLAGTAALASAGNLALQYFGKP